MLKRFRCHKVVEAGRIASVEQVQADGYQLPGWSVTLEGEGLARWLDGKHRPEVGGYFVRYEDGYTSYSPATAFESGYALEEMDGAIYPSKDPQPSVGPFRATVFSKPSGAPIESIADVVEVTAGSAQGGRPELFGVVIDEVDDRGLSRVVCYTGNGPRSEANAYLIAELLTLDASNARPRPSAEVPRKPWPVDKTHCARCGHVYPDGAAICDDPAAPGADRFVCGGVVVPAAPEQSRR